ncbi:hypothetical protein Mgra_00005523 [Meloidogyne graminicola]|uniref:F-box domain-containing protein n=1 Tax=Meloidogyne graminicola TaxID=189291 RepID=A0A8S9ZP80_9BILA|nr:hypothetical protein Mgra_00005523 [Meloidogyne graminicola]
MQSIRLLNELNNYSIKLKKEKNFEKNKDGYPINVKIYPKYLINEEKENIKLNNKQLLFPIEVINEILYFLSFNECSRIYTINKLIYALLEPRRKICMEIFIKRLDATRERLDQTIKINLQEVGQRREHVNQLSEHIEIINIRLEDMGSHLKELDAQILDNHEKLEALHKRIEKMRIPSFEQINE